MVLEVQWGNITKSICSTLIHDIVKLTTTIDHPPPFEPPLLLDFWALLLRRQKRRDKCQKQAKVDQTWDHFVIPWRRGRRGVVIILLLHFEIPIPRASLRSQKKTKYFEKYRYFNGLFRTAGKPYQYPPTLCTITVGFPGLFNQGLLHHFSHVPGEGEGWKWWIIEKE